MDDKDKIIEALQEEIRLLMQRLSELERRLGLNSETSSKPSSTDGLKKKNNRPPQSGRGQEKSKGGQNGHKGNTLKQTQTPDFVVTHKASVCEACQADLSKIETEKITKRQVFDVEIRPHITEHQAETKKCTCGAYTAASFPENVKAPVQIGDQVRAIATYLSGQFIAKDRLSEVMETLFSTPISDTSLIKYETILAINLQPFYDEALRHLLKTNVKHSDETGIRVSKKTDWMHVLSNEDVTYLKHQAKRKVEYEGLTGILVHDHYNSYLKLLDVTHSFCNAHILRELKALITYEKEPWAQDMHRLLQTMCHARNEGTLDETKRTFFGRVYDKIVKRGLDYHESLEPLEKTGTRGRSKKREGHNLLIRLRDFKGGTLLFMENEDVPFTNNQAEQDLRMVKVKQKVSGSFRTVEGAQDFAVIRSYIGTVKKNGQNILEAIKLAFSQKISLSSILTPYKSGLPVLISAA